MQRFQLLEGNAFEESLLVSSVASKRKRFIGDTVQSQKVQMHRFLGPEEVSSPAALCKSGLIEGWDKSLSQEKKGRAGE